MKHVLAVIGLLTAVVGLLTAVANFYPQITKASSPAPTAVSRPSVQGLTATFDLPTPGEMVRDAIYPEVRGTYEGLLPPQARLWLLGRRDGMYHLHAPSAQLVRPQRRWSQANVTLPAPGRWELVLVVASEAGSAALEEHARQADPGGLVRLPDGVQAVQTVAIERR